MKKLKYLLLIMVTTFVSVASVNATQGNVNGSIVSSQITSSSDAQFYYLSGGQITTSFVQTYDNYSPYFSATTGETNTILSFNTMQTLAKDYLYALTLYVGTQNNSNLADIPLLVGQGNWNGGALEGHLNGLTSNSCQADVYAYSNSYNITSNLQIGFDPPASANTKVIYIVIKSNCNYPYISMRINHVTSPGQIYFWGFHAEALGSTSGLTTSQVQSIVNNATSGLATSSDITEIQENIATSEENIKSQIEESTNKIDDTINNTDISDSSSTANSFFEGFTTDDYGLSDIVTMPLELIKGLTSNTCVALSLTLPFVNKTFELPCMSSIYQEYFGSFFTLYQTVTFGFVAYWVIVKIFALVKGFKDPDDDKVEVMDL